jgi:hypothetical protein
MDSLFYKFNSLSYEAIVILSTMIRAVYFSFF